MASTAELHLLLTGRDDASKALHSVKESAGGLGKALGDVSKIAAGFVIGAGLSKLPGLLSSAMKAAADDAASMLRLQRAVENTGVAFSKFGKEIESTIKLGQRLGFTDDETRDSLSLLTAQTGDTGEAMKRLGLAQDLARGAGMDLATASKLLGRVTEENVNVLARYGIKVKEGASETDLFAAVYQKFHGQAQTFADSTAGKMARLKDAISELKERIGGFLLPVMTAVVDVLLTRLVPAIETAVDWIGVRLTGAFENVQAIGSRFADPIVASLKKIPVAVSDLIGTIRRRITESVLLFKIGFDLGDVPGGDALDPLQAAALEAGVGFRKFVDLLKDLGFDKAFDRIKEAVDIGLGAMKEVIDFLGGRRQVLISFAAALGIAATAWVIYSASSLGAAAATRIFSLALLATPIGGLLALGTAILLIAQNWEKISKLGPVKGFIDNMRELAHLFSASFKGSQFIGEFSIIEQAAIKLGAGIRFIVDAVKAFLASQFAADVVAGWVKIWADLQVIAAALWPVIKQVAAAVGEFLSHRQNTIAMTAILLGLMAAFAPGPFVILGVVAALTGLVLAIGFAREHFDEFKAKVLEVWNSIPGPIRAALSFIHDDVTEKIGGVIQIFRAMIDNVRNVIELFTALVHGDWARVWSEVKQIAKNELDIFLGLLKVAFGSIPGIIAGLAADAASAAWNFGKGIANSIGDAIKSGINFIIRQLNSFLSFLRGLRIEIPRIDLPGLPAIGGGSISIPGVPGPFAELHHGSPFVPATGLYMLERGERVLPAGQSTVNNNQRSVIVNVSRMTIQGRGRRDDLDLLLLRL